MLKELNEKNFEENIKQGIKFVTFSADWCGFCQKQKPILKEIANENIWIGEVNPDKNPKLVEKYGSKENIGEYLLNRCNHIGEFCFEKQEDVA